MPNPDTSPAPSSPLTAHSSQAKNLVFLCDGTAREKCAEPGLNEPAHPDHSANAKLENPCYNTNVAHLYARLQQAQHQRARYEPGLGINNPGTATVRKRLGQLFSRLFGYGLTESIESGYQFLLENYQPGDRVFLFGFSRGAYAVRALSGMLDKVGLLLPEHAHLAPKAIRLYNSRNNDAEANAFAEQYCQPCTVHFMGVWDTVASLGYYYRKQRFFNAKLSHAVCHGYQALAIDEKRPKFAPVLWDESRIQPHQTIQQVWFPGAHSDIGGGYEDRALAEITLQWLSQHAQNAGLKLNNNIEPPQPPDPTGTIHQPWNTLNGRMLRLIYGGLKPRQIPSGALLHPSVAARQATMAYNPPELPQQTAWAELPKPKALPASKEA